MNSTLSTLSSAPLCDSLSVNDHEFAHPCIYSFRCSRGMDESLTRLMRERGLNRTSVIRLALYALDGICRRPEVRQLNLPELVGVLENLSPAPRPSFSDFLHGSASTSARAAHPHTPASTGALPPAGCSRALL